ncbi:sugar ABC transporter permease [Brevibacillus sp. HB1.2]|uniref:carbohydrate ABC transporter permease n=1 Tax=Brevibacillus TaxID=55080 RepID=UPI00156BAA87|nr:MULTISPECIES: sugar ABC transporter permease [unclassified Brevibacillus]NRS16542.1 sugar ABC transporter permease [Brevibacillus sp. HB1.4B]NTU20586.1 sugar ABC transporter permease [Brevibacillus sp. HB1.2]NTU34260.1 sugar ABC transporter permease [Brevibacillus sp. HB1.1]
MNAMSSQLQPEMHAAVQQKTKKSLNHMKRNDWFWAYLMIAPTLIGLSVFYLWPIVQTIYLSFTKWGGFGKYKWAGLHNYELLFKDPYLWIALKNTLIYTVIAVPVGIAISIFIAVLLNQKIKGITIYRTLYFLPVVTMAAAVAMVWRWLYNADYGLINYLLGLVGIEGPRWISDPAIALYAVIIVAVWSSIGYNMVIFLAGLQGIPRSYYEAAEIDGAGPVRMFFKITLPLLTPSIFFVSITSLIGAFQVFDLIYLMLGSKMGNPATEQTQTMAYLFFTNGFESGNGGYAAAVAVVLLVMILIVTAIQMKLQKKWVHYD